jgi:hypothetical protein
VRALSVACSGWNASLPFANAVPQDFVMGQPIDYPLGDDHANIHCLSTPMSTAHQQFSKLTLAQDAQFAWWLTARVYDASGQLQSSQTRAL